MLPALEQAGLTARFDAIVTADDVYRGKPDPEGYLYAAQVGLHAGPSELGWRLTLAAAAAVHARGAWSAVGPSRVEDCLCHAYHARRLARSFPVCYPAASCPASMPKAWTLKLRYSADLASAENAAAAAALRRHWQLKPEH